MSITKNLKAIDETDLSTFDGVIRATEAVKAETLRVKKAHDNARGAIMPRAGRTVAAAFDLNVVSVKDGHDLVKKDDEVQQYPLTVRAYAETLGWSHNYIIRLRRLGRALVAGVVTEGSTEASLIQSYGTAGPFAFLDKVTADDDPAKVSEQITKADATRKEADKKAREAKKAEAKKAEEAEAKRAEKAKRDAEVEDTETEAEECFRHLKAAFHLIGSLDDDEKARALEMVGHLVDALTPETEAATA